MTHEEAEADAIASDLARLIFTLEPDEVREVATLVAQHLESKRRPLGSGEVQPAN